MESDEEYNQFLQELQNFPNYFQMGTEKIGTNLWKKVERKINDEREDMLKSGFLNQIKNKNLEACVAYNLVDVEKAKTIISEVLEINPCSMNACAMMALMCYRNGEITRAKKLLKRVKELGTDPFRIDVAKTELAYAFTRLDATFYKKAIEAYKEPVKRYPNNFPWKFGLAVILRRCMSMSVQAIFPDLKMETCFEETKEHLLYVLKYCTQEEDRYFKARSYIELADLYSTSNCIDNIVHTDKESIINLVMQGVQCLPDNTNILMKAGRLLRHCFKFQEAEDLLQKAYNIRPNSYICHHLGLFQKQKIINRYKKSPYPKRDQRYGQNKHQQFVPWRNNKWRDPNYPSILEPKLQQKHHQFQVKVDQPYKDLSTDTSVSTASAKGLIPNQLNKIKSKPAVFTKPIKHDKDLEEDLAIAEPLSQHPLPSLSPYQTDLKGLGQEQRGITLWDRYSPSGFFDHFDPKSLQTFEKGINDNELAPGTNPDKDHQHSAGEAAFNDPIMTNTTERCATQTKVSTTEKELAESFSKMSMPHVVETRKEPERSSSLALQSSGSKSSDVVSWMQSPSTSTNLQQNAIIKMTRIINSPGKETFDLKLSKQLGPCVDLFRQSAELSHHRNFSVYYDWGQTLLQMTPTPFHEVLEKFNYILDNDQSKFVRYRCYEQYGICKLRMSESEDFDEERRRDCQQDAMEMFRRAIQCWAYCQKLELSKHFEDAEKNCNSLRSIREIILGQDLDHGKKPKKDMASLYYLVRQYGESLSLYREVCDELHCTSDNTADSEVIKGIISNHLALHQYTGVLDMLALLLCSREGLQCYKFKITVLTQMLYDSIDSNKYSLAASVFNFEKNEEADHDVVIVFNEDDHVTRNTAANLQIWLNDFSHSVLKVIKSSDTPANLPRLQGQINFICNSNMAIFILADETPPDLCYVMNTALESRCRDNYFLKKIFPVCINNAVIPNIFEAFPSLKITMEAEDNKEDEKSKFLKTFSEIFLN